MAKTILGIDIGYESLKLVLMRDGKMKNYAIVPMPRNLVRRGRVVSPESMGELIRDAMREHGIRCGSAALVLPNEAVFIRNTAMPLMSVEQLKFNLPFEFRDYITDELKNYVFDYAMVTTPQELRDRVQAAGGEKVGTSMELMAVAAPAAILDEARHFLRKAGLKLVKAAPTVSCYQALLRNRKANPALPEETCILDLGYQAIRMYMFHGDRHIVTRELELGMNSLITAVADTAGVDEYLARTYLLENFEDWQNRDLSRRAYESIATELMRAMNFYRFSNPETSLNDIYLAGGGAMLQPLRETIAATVGMTIHSSSELVPGGAEEDACHSLVQAIGATMN